MSADTRNVITDWKRLWQLVSGIHYETPENMVLDELLNVSQELQDGLLQFKPIDASHIKLEKLLTEKKQEKLLPFTERLQELLNLESQQCWDILCYYLINEYRGSASSLTTLITTENNMSKLLDDIWGYYSLERMIVLKIIKNILIFYKVSNHPYHREYKEIVNKLGAEKLKESYLQQLEYLIGEKPPKKLMAGEFFNYQSKLVNWSERNAREIIETCHILLLLCEHVPMLLDDIKRIFNCVKQHSFGRQQNYFNNDNGLHADLSLRLAYAELAIFLKCIDFKNPADCAQLAKDIVADLDTEISRLYHNAEHGPLLLAWMLMRIRCTDVIDNDQQLLRCRHMGKRALDLNCFSYMLDLVASSMFKDDSFVSRIVRQTIYNNLSYMCDYFDGDGSCARHTCIYELLSELLSWPSLAQQFRDQQDGGVRSLYNTLLETFPIDFMHLSMLAAALTKAGMGSYIKSQLETLPLLTDLYNDCKYSLKPTANDELVLTQTVQPFSNIDFQIPAGTVVNVVQRPEGCCAHFQVSVNYFEVLHNEINCLLIETLHYHGDYQGSERIKRVNEGLKLLKVILDQTKSLSGITAQMVHPTEMCIDLLNKFKDVQRPPIELMASCLNVCTALLPLADAEIFIRIINLSILPVITSDTCDDYKKYAQGMYLDAGLVGMYLVDVEKKLARFDFLHAYLNFLRSYAKLQRGKYFDIEIPGLVFLLRDIFPHLHAWHFQQQQDKYKIYAEIMSFICDILDEVTDVEVKEKDKRCSLETTQQLLLRDICVYSMLNLENGMILLRFVSLGNAYLQHTMEMESNWMWQQSHGLILLVRLAMRILMQVLKLRSCLSDASPGLTPLEAMIYTKPKQRDSLRIIPVTTSYMNNIFDRWLPILSCRLLKRIALEFDMSLLACLDMEADQIRMTFLQKLPDELESDSLKIAVLELVEACIEKQPGVTEAFFKVNYHTEKSIMGKTETESESPQLTDSIVTFIEDYLEAVGTDPMIVAQILPSKIMNLFHTLWKQNMQILVDALIDKPTFWDNLCNPLFSEFQSSSRIYTQLLNILAIEVFCSLQRNSDSLKRIILKFFNEEYFKKWLDFIFDMPKEPISNDHHTDTITNEETMPEWLCRVQAFKSFLLILLKKQPKFVEVPVKQLKLLAEKCLQLMVERSQYVEDLRPLILISELYLLILLNFKHNYTEKPEEDTIMLEQLNSLLSNISSCYVELHSRAKIACLAVTIKCTDLLTEELLRNSNVSHNFLHSIVNIICAELHYLELSIVPQMELQQANVISCHQSSSEEVASRNFLILCLNLLKTVATVFHTEGPRNWDSPFLSNKVVQRLVSSASSILQLFSKQQLSVELLDVLIVFAKGDCSQEFLYSDVGDYLWLKLLPPRELLQSSEAVMQTQKVEWSVEKWWPIYARGIQLVTLLFQKHNQHFLKETLQFVGIHEEYLVDSLLLCKQSLEPAAMNLIKSTITLLASVVEYEKQWRLEHSQSLFNLMRSVQILMGHSISMFHQPKNLKLLINPPRSHLEILRETDNTELADEVINAFNDLTEIIILCCKCLQRFSPMLLDLICEPELLISKWEPIFEIHFGAPKLNENAITVTFGTVLSIVGVYTKVLNLQNYGFHEVPLNVLPIVTTSDKEPNNAINATNDSVINATPRRPFSKSMSVVSTSSVNCPPNELLANLDGELCLIALEHILSLVASQSMLALRNPLLTTREKQFIRRDISSELLSYQEFVRKKVLIDYREHREIWHRRKHGQVLMMQMEEVNDKEAPSDTQQQRSNGAAISARRSNELRVNVVRKLHLQQQQQQQQQRSPLDSMNGQGGGSNFEMSRVISPIGSMKSHMGPPLASTPNLARPSIRRLTEQETIDTTKQATLSGEQQDEGEVEDKEEEEITHFPPEEPKYSPLSYIQFIEEDYLHLMANLFHVICQND